MRLYLGLDNMTAQSNEIVKVEIYYLPHYDLIKLHKMMLIFVQQRTPSYLAFSPLSLHEVGCDTEKLLCLWLKVCGRKKSALLMDVVVIKED